MQATSVLLDPKKPLMQTQGQFADLAIPTSPSMYRGVRVRVCVLHLRKHDDALRASTIFKESSWKVSQREKYQTLLTQTHMIVEQVSFRDTWDNLGRDKKGRLMPKSSNLQPMMSSYWQACLIKRHQPWGAGRLLVFVHRFGNWIRSDVRLNQPCQSRQCTSLTPSLSLHWPNCNCHLYIYHVTYDLMFGFTIAWAYSKSLTMLVIFHFLASIVGAAPHYRWMWRCRWYIHSFKSGRAMSFWSMGPLTGSVIGLVDSSFFIIHWPTNSPNPCSSAAICFSAPV